MGGRGINKFSPGQFPETRLLFFALHSYNTLFMKNVLALINLGTAAAIKCILKSWNYVLKGSILLISEFEPFILTLSFIQKFALSEAAVQRCS